MAKWTAGDMGDQSGKVAVVTGANSGIGYHTSLELARAGARVVLACRDALRGQDAIARIKTEVPKGDVELAILDLADLDSIHRFAQQLSKRLSGIDLLINNAGVMAVPKRRTTVQGFELQLGTNHLGHFALTGLLLPWLVARPGARIVTVSSINHKRGKIDFDDLQGERQYSPWGAYNQSKLANLLFAFELDRRLGAKGLKQLCPGTVGGPPPRMKMCFTMPEQFHGKTLSIATHPGVAATNLQTSGPRLGGGGLQALALVMAVRVIGQSEARGALPSLYAATSPEAVSGAYYGPDGLGQMRGSPIRVRPAPKALDESKAHRLWTVSAALTHVTFESLDV